MKRILCILTSLIIMLTPIAYATNYTYDDIDTLKELISENDSDMEDAHRMAENARRYGFAETSEIIQSATDKYYCASNRKTVYKFYYDILTEKWHQKEEEYPVATYIWSYLKKLGYSNPICAGIIGNAMAECGGQTLDIQYDLDTWGYYGTFMWSKRYHPLRKGTSLEAQMDYLRDTLEPQFKMFGPYDGYTYEQFLNTTDAGQAAVIFAKVYERCSSGSYRVRRNNAQVALSYFTS